MRQYLLIIFLLMGMLLAPLLALADSDGDNAKKNLRHYNQKIQYEGIFDPEQIYILFDKNRNWVGSKKPRTLLQVRCAQALLALESRGHWFGRIRPDGSCPSGDADEWRLGNYLNFLGQELDKSKK